LTGASARLLAATPNSHAPVFDSNHAFSASGSITADAGGVVRAGFVRTAGNGVINGLALSLPSSFARLEPHQRMLDPFLWLRTAP